MVAALVSVAGIGVASAHGGMFGPDSDVATKLAERFNLNADDVSAFFQEQQTARQADMEAKFEERLNQAVADGKITSEQKDAILAKHQEMQTNREANLEEFKNMTQEEHRAQMEAQRAEMQQWAKDNGLQDFRMLGGLMGDGGRGMFGKGHAPESE